MLKTNSKEARANIRTYIIRNFDGENYTENPPTEWPEIAAFILATFRKEKYYCENLRRYYRYNESVAFADWAAGLPSVLDTLYYYNRSAVDDLGEILQESESEKAKYTEQQAESLLTSLIYRELLRGCK